MKKVSPSLLNGIKLYREEPEKIKELLNKTEKKRTQSQQKGINFEEDLAVLNGNTNIKKTIPIDKWLPNKEKMLNIIQGSVWQKEVSKILIIEEEEFYLHGFIDFLNEETKEIIDIKTTYKYILGEQKFLFSLQHLCYFECLEGFNKFKYLINSWDNPNDIFIEEYQRQENNTERIINAILFCRKILSQYNLDFLQN